MLTVGEVSYRRAMQRALQEGLASGASAFE